MLSNFSQQNQEVIVEKKSHDQRDASQLFHNRTSEKNLLLRDHDVTL